MKPSLEFFFCLVSSPVLELTKVGWCSNGEDLCSPVMMYGILSLVMTEEAKVLMKAISWAPTWNPKVHFLNCKWDKNKMACLYSAVLEDVCCQQSKRKKGISWWNSVFLCSPTWVYTLLKYFLPCTASPLSLTPLSCGNTQTSRGDMASSLLDTCPSPQHTPPLPWRWLTLCTLPLSWPQSPPMAWGHHIVLRLIIQRLCMVFVICPSDHPLSFPF